MDEARASTPVNIVCIPYRSDTPERDANFDRTRAQWAGWCVLTADSDGETFGRSQAVNRAVVKAGDWDVLVIADSDLLLEDVDQASEALQRAGRHGGYVVCYDEFHYLDEGASVSVRGGLVPTPRMAYYTLTQIWGGMFAIGRELWDEIGGFDETITSWGGEDGRFLDGVPEKRRSRVVGGCYHLKHPLVPGGR